MSFFLRNYTSDVPVSKTIFRIEQVLIACGVAGITKEYGSGGTVAAVRLTIQLPNAPRADVRLPVDVDHAQNALWKNYTQGEELSKDGESISLFSNSRKKMKKKDFRQQAERTARDPRSVTAFLKTPYIAHLVGASVPINTIGHAIRYRL